MQPLETNCRILVWMCVYPCDENTTIWMRSAHILFSVFIFVMNTTGFVFSGAYFVKYVSIDLEQSLFALLQTVGEANMLYILAITFILRHKITAMMRSLSRIYDMCKNTTEMYLLLFIIFILSLLPSSISPIADVTIEMSLFLTKVNQCSDWMWSMFFKYAICYALCTGTVAIIAFQWAEDGNYAKIYRTFKFL